MTVISIYFNILNTWHLPCNNKVSVAAFAGGPITKRNQKDYFRRSQGTNFKLCKGRPLLRED
jgi:hypothetical protein